MRPSFVKFLVKAVPLVLAEMDSASRSRAFDGYQLIEEEADKQVKVFTIKIMTINELLALFKLTCR